MRYLIIRKNKEKTNDEWKMTMVQTPVCYPNKTIEELKEACVKSSNDTLRFDMIEVTDEIYDIVSFALGEDYYQNQITLRNLKSRLDDLSQKFDCIESDLDDYRYEIESVSRDLIKFIKEENDSNE